MKRAFLTVDLDCLIATPYHQAMNRIRERSRNGRHGSCGVGIGEARSYWLKYGSDAITAEDLGSFRLHRKLSLLRQRLCAEIQEGDFIVYKENRFYDWAAMDVLRTLNQDAEGIEIGGSIQDCETAVFEAAQGVLIDETWGFHPYTTWSTVTLHHAEELIPDDCEVTRLGVTRCYLARHGAGPLPTESAEMEAAAIDYHNPENAWQGKIRMGWMDMRLLRYAIKHCGGTLDGLVVNHLDQLPERSLVFDGGDIGSMCPTLSEQQSLGQYIMSPEHFSSEAVSLKSLLERMYSVCPIVMTSRGPTHFDRSTQICVAVGLGISPR